MLKNTWIVAIIAILTWAGSNLQHDAAFAPVNDEDVASLSGASCGWFVWNRCTPFGSTPKDVPKHIPRGCSRIRCWVPTRTNEGEISLKYADLEWCTRDGSYIEGCGRRYPDCVDCTSTGGTGNL